MKSRMNKILTVITAVTFVAALTINIQASFNDPFAGMSDAAITSSTSGGTTVVEIPCANATIAPVGIIKRMICLDENYKVYCKNDYYTDYAGEGLCIFISEPE